MCVVTKTSLRQWGVKNIRCLKKKGSTFDELMWIRFSFHALWRCVQACVQACALSARFHSPRKPKLRLLFNSRRLPDRSLSFLHVSSSVYASVRRAGDGYEDESHLSLLLSVFTAL